MKTFEYDVLFFQVKKQKDYDAMRSALNERGAEGWEGCCHVNLSAIGEGIALVGSSDVRSRFPDIKCLQPMEADG